MVITNCIRRKRFFTLIFILSFITVFLLAFLTLFHRKIDDDVLPFDSSEIDITKSNSFFSLKDIFREAVPDITHIRYHQNSAKPCSLNSPSLLAVVHSAPAHFLHRKSIRQTWGSSIDGLTMRVIFVVGRSQQPLVWDRTKQEASSNGDVLLVDMLDKYSNLTLKHLVWITWALKNCPNVSYIMKADDDAFIDMHRVKKIVVPNLPLNTIACRIVPAGTEPKRSGKWKVSRLEYPFDDYPEYCSGLSYFSRPSTLATLLRVSTSGEVPYIWIDDVFITGFSASRANIKRMDLTVWFARTEDQVLKWLHNKDFTQSLPWMVSELTPRHWPTDAVAIWNKTKHFKII